MSVSVRNIGTMMHSWNPGIPGLERLRSEEHKFLDSLGTMGTMFLKKILVGTKLWNFSDLVQGRWKVFQLR